MALLASERFPAFQDVILPVVIGTTVLFELTGPDCHPGSRSLGPPRRRLDIAQGQKKSIQAEKKPPEGGSSSPRNSYCSGLNFAFPSPSNRARLHVLGRAKRAEKLTGTFQAINKLRRLFRISDEVVIRQPVDL